MSSSGADHCYLTAMSSQTSFGSSMLFQTINDDLNASLATADELSREFNSLFKEVSPNIKNTQSGSKTSTLITRETQRPQSPGLSTTSITTREPRGSSNGTSLFTSSSQSSTSLRSLDSASSSNKNAPSSPMFPTSPISSATIRKEAHSPLPRSGSDSYSYSQQSPRQSPHTPRRNSPSRYDRSPQASGNYVERSPSPSTTAVSFDQPLRSSSHLSSPKLLSPYESQMGRRSPRPDRSPSTMPFNYPVSNTLPRFGLKQPALIPGDVDAELERLDHVGNIPVIPENTNIPEGSRELEEVEPPASRPLSPTRLQPVVAPEAQTQQIPDREELLRIRAEIPRALKRRGSMDQSIPLKNAAQYQPNQYKTLIDKLFRRKERRQKGEQDVETSSSSDGEEPAMPPPPLPTPQTSSLIPTDFRSYHSILRRSKRERKGSGNRARLSPLILLLDGALVGELETVQRAVQEMNDPSQANDEGITALHNAICGGHYDVVDFLVRSGANVSAPDSHGWTPLHCAASCNDRALCEFLVRNGAAVMAITESDGATASQKCDPYAVGFEECESFLRGVEEAMGVENSGVLYALWSYPAQAADELSFKEGDMVTILQKPEGMDWWWASLCGREGFVPNNYFGLFPKVRPKSLC
ncbi:RelA-associated inhibitor Inhibitor of ASPP protein [Channa argus]|uniref:RelA-associated inhibitor Inhibitor of ASPP protein n=1 Tax=Channa argus TaxID=215402 RepID=A0A6G1PSS8_CHAAH|nr:RelA-associated inhibitor Inhibitor of ASPP protein [Channa argus]